MKNPIEELQTEAIKNLFFSKSDGILLVYFALQFFPLLHSGVCLTSATHSDILWSVHVVFLFTLFNYF